MSTLDVVTQAKKFAQHCQAVIDLAAWAERAGSIEQAAGEADARLAVARDAVTKELAELARVRDAVAAASAKASEIAAGAQAEAERIVQAAHAEADGIRVRAQAILADAQAEKDRSDAVVASNRGVLALVERIASKQKPGA
jgi:cell division septum initiation protein DivIVA